MQEVRGRRRGGSTPSDTPPPGRARRCRPYRPDRPRRLRTARPARPFVQGYERLRSSPRPLARTPAPRRRAQRPRRGRCRAAHRCGRELGPRQCWRQREACPPGTRQRRPAGSQRTPSTTSVVARRASCEPSQTRRGDHIDARTQRPERERRWLQHRQHPPDPRGVGGRGRAGRVPADRPARHPARRRHLPRRPGDVVRRDRPSRRHDPLRPDHRRHVVADQGSAQRAPMWGRSCDEAWRTSKSR